MSGKRVGLTSRGGVRYGRAVVGRSGSEDTRRRILLFFELFDVDVDGG